MLYFSTVIIDIIYLSLSALILNSIFKIKLNHCFLISIIINGIFIYLIYSLLPLNFFRLGFYIYLITIFFFIIGYALKKKINRFNKKLLIEFFVISFIISIFCFNKYFLDEDELNHWGRIIKYFHIITNSEINKIPEIYLYHQPFLPVIHFFNSFVSGFREDISIFSNNLFLISSFYFLFYQKKISFYKRIFLFVIFYLCLNNLSFGFVSIYADPIISVLYCCLIFYIYSKNNSYQEYKDWFIIFVLSSALFLVHRSGVIYIIFATFLYFFLINSYNKENYFKFILVNLIFFFYLFLSRINIKNFLTLFDVKPFKIFFDTFLFTDIYFSDFGVSANLILFNFGFDNFKLPTYDINVLFWFLLIFVTTVCSCKNNYKMIFFILFQFFGYSFLIYFYKIKLDELSILVYGRYIGIFFLSILLLNILILSISINRFNKIVIFLLFITLALITPLKSFGFFLSHKKFLTQEQNKDFWHQKQTIKAISSRLTPGHRPYVILGSMTSNTIKYHPTMIFSLMNFEFYPFPGWLVAVIPLKNYLSEADKFLEPNLIFYNLTNDEKEKVENKRYFNKKIIFLNFD
jgi:hypothetical protein